MYYLYDTTTGQVAGKTSDLADANASPVSGLSVYETADDLGDLTKVKIISGSPVYDTAAIDKEEVLKERNALLAASDWWAVSDRTMTQAQIDYRQALRDITDQDGYPSNVTWPVKP